MFEVTSAWKSAFRDAHVGILIMRDVINPAHHPELENRRTEIEVGLRSQFSRLDRSALSNLPVLQVYGEYYKRFKKTYHVQLQLESIIWKGKAIPNVSALVEAMFMAEVKNMLLTAAHDLDTLQLPLTLDVSRGTESYTLMRGEEQIVKAGDMMISDQAGIISNIIYGPDRRTQITADTRNVIFTVYAPTGIDKQSVTQHLQDIQDYVMIIAPQTGVQLLKVYGAEQRTG
jgi:DNA/RNA-binding domain of Phe-tRNA-synthetase-like protein